MHGSIIDVEVRINGRKAQEYQHEGKTWIEGRKGSNYSLRIRNTCSRRVLVIPSVDGLSVIDGEAASYNSRGYLIGGHEFVDIPGWRLNNDAVAQFVFGKKGKSYAALSGDARNAGVIGVAVFHEEQYWTILTTSCNDPSDTPRTAYHTFHMADAGGVAGAASSGGTFNTQAQSILRGASTSIFTASASGTATHVTSNNIAPPQKGRNRGCFDDRQMSAVSHELGTEFGKQIEHKIQEVPFKKATNTPAETVELHYDSRKNLRKRGVDLQQKPKVPREPNAFPGETGCKPPAGWEG